MVQLAWKDTPSPIRIQAFFLILGLISLSSRFTAVLPRVAGLVPLSSNRLLALQPSQLKAGL